MALPSAILQRGDRASQPAAASVAAGVCYCVTDENNIVEQSDGAAWQPYSATGAGTGDVNGPAASIEQELALFDGTTGKLLERATGTGIVRVTSGVYGTPGNVVESEITLADNTTNNAATTKHGFLKKLSNVATEYMDGTGAWSVPAGAGGGGLTLLDSDTASASASLDFPTVFSATYDTYKIVLDSIVPATNSAIPYIRFSTDGSTFSTTAGNYVWGHVNVQFGGVSGSNAGSLTTETALKLFTDSASSAGISSSFPFDMELTLSNPLGSAFRKNIWGQGNAVYATGPASYMFSFGGIWTPTTALTGFQFLFSTGNITSGSVRVYGVEK